MPEPVRAISLLESPPEAIELYPSSLEENISTDSAKISTLEVNQTECKPDHTDYESQIGRTSIQESWQVQDLLSLCCATDYDPLSPWSPTPNALYALLLQCPIFLRQLTNAEYSMIGDTSLARAILSRMSPDELIRVTVLTSDDINLIDDLSLILKRPRVAEWIEPKLSCLVGHWIDAKSDIPKTLASLLDITLAGLRKSKSRKKP